MKHIKGELLTGDFVENTMTFEIEGEFTLQAGSYIIVREEEYKAPKMGRALIACLAYIKKHNLIDPADYEKEFENNIESLLKEIDNEN